ncbi:MAG: rod shape-determining protein MreC [Spirochaetota bacterium]
MTDLGKNRTIIAYAAATAVCLIFIIFSKAEFSLDVKKLYSVTVYPFQYGTQKVFRTIADWYASISELTRLREELRQTREKLAVYENAAVEFEEIKNENKRLSELLQMQKQIEYRTVAATIVSKDPQNFYSTIIVNRGYQDGVEIGMPVIAYRDAAKGVVGKVIEVSRRYARILPITDQNCKIGAMLETTRATGILAGEQPRSLLCNLAFVDRVVPVATNESVVTSGMGGIFPKGLVIGTVSAVDRKLYGLFQSITVRPLLDFATLEDIYIILKKADTDISSILDEE